MNRYQKVLIYLICGVMIVLDGITPAFAQSNGITQFGSGPCNLDTQEMRQFLKDGVHYVQFLVERNPDSDFAKTMGKHLHFKEQAMQILTEVPVDVKWMNPEEVAKLIPPDLGGQAPAGGLITYGSGSDGRGFPPTKFEIILSNKDARLPHCEHFDDKQGLSYGDSYNWLLAHELSRAVIIVLTRYEQFGGTGYDQHTRSLEYFGDRYYHFAY
jgi:hypothetical protein